MTGHQLQIEIRAAIKSGDFDEFRKLLSVHRSALTMTTVFGTWLHVASSYGRLDMVEWLIAQGVDVNARGGVAGGGALHRASTDGHCDVVKCLIDSGAELDVSAPERNPLFGAILGGHMSIARLLVDRGFDMRIRYTGETMRGMDAIAFAHERGQTEIAAFLENQQRGNAGGGAGT